MFKSIYQVLLYILILTLQNMSGYYGLHFTVGEIRVERVKNLAQKLKSRKRWKQEVAVWPQSLCNLSKLSQPLKGREEAWEPYKGSPPLSEAAKSELLLPLKLETTQLTFRWSAQAQKEAAAALLMPPVPSQTRGTATTWATTLQSTQRLSH